LTHCRDGSVSRCSHFHASEILGWGFPSGHLSYQSHLTKLLSFDTPLHTLLGASPDYTTFHTFGCACWPNLRPYNSHKLELRSTKCVFLGYSNKGYKCLDISKGHIYVSRDVIFDESSFPFASLPSNAGTRYTSDVLLLPRNNALTNPANTPTISYLPIFDVHVQMPLDLCSLHGAGTLHWDPASSATASAPPGIQAPLVDVSMTPNSASCDMAASPLVPIPDPIPDAPTPAHGMNRSPSRLALELVCSDNTVPAPDSSLRSALTPIPGVPVIEYILGSASVPSLGVSTSTVLPGSSAALSAPANNSVAPAAPQT
jgi:hypothetical protein